MVQNLYAKFFHVAEEDAPYIVFIDEIHAIGTKQEIQRTTLELLSQLDGFDSRGDVKIEISLSDVKTKRRIFNNNTERIDDVDLETFVISKDDLSDTDIKTICT
ncbi:24571_t:CDS:2 [Cetraspora pellucida]|uniref:24571_t:CDS:1 n=1 Tax=Cetraspora pellucida TaxID=1433469 RepID=A0A9N9B2N8_9GLOM|nr:24571_t:CDS:2 [Cetraspora pellucida]